LTPALGNLTVLAQVSYGNIQIFLSGLRMVLTDGKATASSSNESRLSGSIDAIAESFGELHEALSTPLQEYLVLKSFLVVVTGGDMLNSRIASLSTVLTEVRCGATKMHLLQAAAGDHLDRLPVGSFVHS
jgi:hypothetical protein